VNAAESIQNLWKRWTGNIGADAGVAPAAGNSVPRKTVALPSILGPYQAPANLLPKPTPVNLRRFAETPLVRRAINVIKDRIASLDWQIKLKRGYSTATVADAEQRGAVLRQTLEGPNSGDSFRTLIEQVLEDAIEVRLSPRAGAVAGEVARVTATIESDPSLRLAELETKLQAAEMKIAELRAQASGPLAAGRKTLPVAAAHLLAKHGIDTLEQVNGGALDAALGGLSLEQRIAVKSQLIRAGLLG
jgi:hypothetical protein